jgi:hypothetical protein
MAQEINREIGKIGEHRIIIFQTMQTKTEKIGKTTMD